MPTTDPQSTAPPVAQHTPGPWEASFVEESPLACARWIVLGPKPAANKPGNVVCDIEICGEQAATDKEVAAADARLIAAAPDLLIACEAAILFVDDPYAAKLLRAAIAKARGQ